MFVEDWLFSPTLLLVVRWDKRTNLCILSKYFTADIMSDAYKFSDSGKYFAPAEGDLPSFREYVDSLPQDDAPETFGLHDNADITLQQKETRDLMTTIVSMQPRASAGSSGRSPDEIVSDMAVDFESRLPKDFNKSEAHAATFAQLEDGSVNSLGVFAEQEMVR